MSRELRKQQKNNGFTLIEVLVAVIIIAIVSIPVLKAFVTSAQTTSRSKMKMRATNAAENIMEDLEGLSVEQAVQKYSLGSLNSPNADGENKTAPNYTSAAYRIFLDEITDDIPSFDKDLNEALKNGYQAEIFIDPTYYNYSNGVNVSNFDILSSDIAAIFSMTPELNSKAYTAFVKRHKEYYKVKYPDDTTNICDEHVFADQRLYREIRVDIEKKGMITNANGEEYPKVTVTVTVSYLLPDAKNKNPGASSQQLVDEEDTTYVAYNRQIFSNAVSEKKLSSIFVMYYPLYEMAGKGGDIITVHNHDDVEADFYVVAQNTDINADKFKDYRDKDKGGLWLDIYEDEVEDSFSGEKKQPLRLRTNLIDETKVAYVSESKSEDNVVPIQCYLHLNKSSADKINIGDPFDETTLGKIKQGKFEDKEATKALNAGALDGKTLDESTIPNRIYDVTVSVWKKPEGYDPVSYDDYETHVSADPQEWPVSVSLTGSMLQKGE